MVVVICSKDIFEISFKNFIRYSPKNCEEWHAVPLIMEDLRTPEEKLSQMRILIIAFNSCL